MLRTLLLQIRKSSYLIRKLLLLLNKYFDERKLEDHAQYAEVQLILEDLLSHEIDALLALRQPNARFSLLASQEIARLEEELGIGQSTA